MTSRTDPATATDVPLAKPRHGILRLINRVRVELIDALDRELSAFDISAPQLFVLSSVANGEADSAAGLCKTISYDPGAMTRMIEGDAAAAISQLQAARDRQAALTTDVLPRARMAIEPAVASYGAGQLPLVSVIEAIQALWGVQSDLIAADTQLGLAWARLGRAIGSYEAIVQ